MEFNYEHNGMQAAGVITFPDWNFSDEPLQPEQIRETVYVIGRPIGGTVMITGTVDS